MLNTLWSNRTFYFFRSSSYAVARRCSSNWRKWNKRTAMSNYSWLSWLPIWWFLPQLVCSQQTSGQHSRRLPKHQVHLHRWWLTPRFLTFHAPPVSSSTIDFASLFLFPIIFYLFACCTSNNLKAEVVPVLTEVLPSPHFLVSTQLHSL